MKYKLNFINRKAGIDILGTADWPTLEWARKALADEVKLEVWRHKTYWDMPKVAVKKIQDGYKVGNLQIKIVAWE